MENKYKFDTELFDRVLAANQLNRDKLLTIILHRMNETDKLVENMKGNFGKMVNGERNWPVEYVCATEEILNKSFLYFTQGEKKDTLMGEYIPHGIEYVAYKDDEKMYKEAFSECCDDDSFVAGNYDEYNKSIMDYILKYNSLKGVRFLIENDIIKFSIWNSYILSCNSNYNLINLYDENRVLYFIKLVLEMDDAALFNKFMCFDDMNRIMEIERSLVFKKDFLQEVLRTKNILQNIMEGMYFSIQDANPHLAGSKNDYPEKLMFAHPITNVLLKTAMEMKNYELCEQIIYRGIEINTEIGKTIHCIEGIKPSELKISKEGYVIYGHFTKLGMAVQYDETENTDLPDSLASALHDLAKSVNDIKYSDSYSPGGNAIHKTGISDDGKTLVKLTSGNAVEYEMLKYMEEKNFSFVPKYYGTEDGLDTFENFNGKKYHHLQDIEPGSVYQLVSFLKEFQRISKEKLGDKVYVHHELSCKNLVFDDDKLVGVENWDKCSVGEAYEDFFYIVYTWCGINKLSEDRKIKLNIIRQMEDVYGLDGTMRQSFGSSFKAYLEKMLLNLDKTCFNYENKFIEVKSAMVFVDLYIDELNNL